MALDPSISLAVQPPKFESPVNVMSQAYALQNAAQQNRLAQMQMAEYERARSEEDALRNYLRGADLSAPEARRNLLQYGKTGLAYGKALYEQETAALEQQAKQLKYKADLAEQAGRIYGTVTDEASWQRARPKLAALGGDASMLPLNYDPAYVESEIGQVLSVKDRAERHFAEQNVGGTVRTLATPKYVLPGQPAPVATVVSGSEAAKTMTPYEKGHLAVQQGQLKVAQGNLGVSQQREARLAQGPMGTTLTPEQNDALFGENGAVAQGKINPNRINGRNAKIWADAFLRNPNADPVKVAQDVATADKAIKDFGTGPQGVKITAFNTAIDHLDTLDKLGAALQNGDIKQFNAIANALGVQSGQPAATMYNQASRIVGGEISKAIVPGVGTGKEREETAAAFNSALSPDQLAGASAVAKKLLGGQLNSLEQQYSRTTKRKDFADQFLTPAARAAYQSNRPATAPAAAPAAALSSLSNDELLKQLGVSPQ